VKKEIFCHKCDEWRERYIKVLKEKEELKKKLEEIENEKR